MAKDLGDNREDKRAAGATLFATYYWRVFALMHKELRRTGFTSDPHACRHSFWKVVPPGVYSPEKGRVFVLQYLKTLERDLAASLSRHSVAYWLHLYRRLAPSSVGEDTHPVTVMLTRAAFEAAAQKYARFSRCGRVAISNEVPIERVLNGILMAPEYELEREIVEAAPQLVLTDFGMAELREFYELEKLAYEVWRCGAQLRTLGKGAPLVVEEDPVEVSDGRSAELEKLLEHYDARLAQRGLLHVSATGTVFFDDISGSPLHGTVMLPTYNVRRQPFSVLSEAMGKIFNIHVGVGTRTNFMWAPFRLRSYFEAHRPFSHAFEEKHGVSLESVLAVIAALCLRVLHFWRETRGESFLRLWQRAYEGPHSRSYVRDQVQFFLPLGMRLLNLGESERSTVDVDAGMAFWELQEEKRALIDIAYPGPHSVFVPFGADCFFIDYAWVFRRLFDLFLEVRVSDQNFKGEALERCIHHGESVLRTKPCKSWEGEQRQVDAAFEVGNHLLIVECRAVARSIGFERGDPQAIRFRDRVVDRALSDVDEKARWLACHPFGKNYDIRRFRAIIPVAVTPFVEFIPSLDARYWLTEELPRVLTVAELKKALDDDVFTQVLSNAVPIHATSS